jgi:putative phosphoribosyl transferase
MLVPLRFSDRAEAGRALATRLLDFTEPPTVVLGVPSGGVLTAAPIAERLAAPLAGAWVRKMVSPQEPDVVFGAVDLDGEVTLSTETVAAEGLADDEVAEIAWHAHQLLLAEWERAPGLDASSLLPGATAIVVDDCLVTGLTLRAAMRWARRQFARAVILAVPVVDRRIWHRVAGDADRAISLEEREDGPVARSDVYGEFRRPSPEEVGRILGLAARHADAARG